MFLGIRILDVARADRGQQRTVCVPDRHRTVRALRHLRDHERKRRLRAEPPDERRTGDDHHEHDRERDDQPPAPARVLRSCDRRCFVVFAHR